MRVTVEIPDEVLAELCRSLRISESGPAIAKAVNEFLRFEKARDFALLLRNGQFDYPATNDQVENLQG